MNRAERRRAEQATRRHARGVVRQTAAQLRTTVDQLHQLVESKVRMAANHDALMTNDALFDTARDIRRQAQQLLNDGHPELARELVADAVLLESAAQPV